MSEPTVARARTAVAAVFVMAGLAVATWLSRIPEVRDHLDLTPGELGRVLLALALGSVLALPTAGVLVNRFGAGPVVAVGTSLGGLGLLAIGLGGGPLRSAAVVAVGLFVAGYGVGSWDVAMNVEGAAVERRLGRSIMPRLHAGFSLGTVAGAGLGAAAAAIAVPVSVHIGVVAALVVAVGSTATRFFLPTDRVAAAGPAGPPGAGRPGVWSAWREPRTLLIGVLVLTFALSEGIAYDWLAVGLVDGLGVGNAIGAIGLAVFVTAMTAGRAVGTVVIDRFGRVPVLRLGAALAAAGVLLVVFGGSLPLALSGAVVWGLGTALGFPVGMSAAADEPARAAIRVSVVASVAYTAFLAGPPLLGWLGDHFGVHRALLVAAAAMAIGAQVAAATRPLPGPDPDRSGTGPVRPAPAGTAPRDGGPAGP